MLLIKKVLVTPYLNKNSVGVTLYIFRSQYGCKLIYFFNIKNLNKTDNVNNTHIMNSRT